MGTVRIVQFSDMQIPRPGRVYATWSPKAFIPATKQAETELQAAEAYLRRAVKRYRAAVETQQQLVAREKQLLSEGRLKKL